MVKLYCLLILSSMFFFSCSPTAPEENTIEVRPVIDFIKHGAITTTPKRETRFRYYKFNVNATAVGGTYEPILTETHFVLTGDAYPPTGSYQVLSRDSISNGIFNYLFDGDITTGPNNPIPYSGYIKFTAPWQWTIDMNQEYRFDSFFLAAYDVGFYHEPSDVTIYGSNNSTGPWTQIGAQVFTTSYTTATISLVY